MEPSDHEIKTLIEMSAKGDAESYKKLYEHLVDKVYIYTQYRTATKELAIDITQDVFIDLFTALSNFTYKSSAQFYAFVFVIARRKLAKHYTETNVTGSNKNLPFDEETMTELPSNITDNQTINLDIQTALSHLEEKDREIVVLHHWARHTFGEIALLMNMTESAIRVRHHRALKILATKLED